MAPTYMTKQGDTWDLISYDIYGDEKYMRYLIEANWPLLDVLVFQSGVEITVPDLPEEMDEDVPFWRMGDNESDEDYSSIEEGDGDE